MDLYKEKISSTEQNIKRLRNPLKLQGCNAKIKKLQSKINELERQIKDKTYPKAVFGSRKLRQ